MLETFEKKLKECRGKQLTEILTNLVVLIHLFLLFYTNNKRIQYNCILLFEENWTYLQNFCCFSLSIQNPVVIITAPNQRMNSQ